MASPKSKGKSATAKKPHRLVRVTISLDPEAYAAFERLGDKAHLSRSWLIRKAMREFLDRNSDTLAIGK